MQGTQSLFLPVNLPEPGPDTAESLWRSLHFFNLYRLAVASVFLFIVIVYGRGFTFGSQDVRLFLWTSGAYWLAAWVLIFVRGRLPVRFPTLLALEVVIDILALTLITHASGGHRSGIPFMLLVVLAGAGLVGQGRSTLFYASLASLALFLEQGYRTVNLGADPGDFAQIGLISIGCFAIAITARLLASRVIANEQLARQRGIDLANQLRINDQVIRDMQDGVLVVNADLKVRQHNPQAESLLGVVPPAAAELSVYSIALAERLGRLSRGADKPTCAILAPGSGKSLQARFVAAGEGGDWLIYLEDLDRAQSRAQQLKLAALGRLTANIAHEIRNPLSAITHAAELLREEKRGDVQGRLTRIINDNAGRLNRMVRDVLELGQRDRVEPEAIPLVAFIEAFVEEFSMHERAQRAIVIIDIAPEATLVFDRAHLNQVLWNLMRNALRYCSGKDGALRIRAISGPDAGPASNRIELHVIDDGPSIAAELRGQIFEPFFTTDSKGTGLGLYIARELCEANGALLELLDNAPGAHFRLTGRKTGNHK